MTGLTIPKRNGSGDQIDAVVLGAGPNGLAAAIAIAREGYRMLVIEGRETVGGGARSAPLTLPGYVHDVCSAVHPLAAASPFFRTLPLEAHGLTWVQPPVPLAHPLDGDRAAVLHRSIDDTARELGADGAVWRKIVGPVVDGWEEIARDVLGPLRVPRHPLASGRFALRALRSGEGLARCFDGATARALVAGLAAHAVLPLDRRPTAAAAIVLGALGHVVGWPFPRGGSQRIADALAGCLALHGGRVVTGRSVARLDELPRARAVLLDVTPRQLLALAGDRLPRRYRRRMARYRYGPAVFKLDWALSEPIPWRAPSCADAGTLHLGGTFEEVAASEDAVWRGEHPERPFVLLAQPSRFDATRAPAGRHTAWAYCHVPSGSTRDMTAAIEAQVERFAPGFRDLVLARHAMGPADLEAYNPNYVGGDITGGVQDLRQLWARPAPRLDPYAVPIPGTYLCSSSTPPGGGVHGLCGAHAARSALVHALRR